MDVGSAVNAGAINCHFHVGLAAASLLQTHAEITVATYTFQLMNDNILVRKLLNKYL